MNRLKNIDSNRSKASSTRSYAATDATINAFGVAPARPGQLSDLCGEQGFCLPSLKQNPR
jgi:hypothetical protein